jgi:hypothetical protein
MKRKIFNAMNNKTKNLAMNAKAKICTKYKKNILQRIFLTIYTKKSFAIKIRLKIELVIIELLLILYKKCIFFIFSFPSAGSFPRNPISRGNTG